MFAAGKRLVDNGPLALAVALVLAFIPMLNWLGVALAVLVILRHGGLVASLGYVVVCAAAYFTLSAYSVSLVAKEWAAVLMMFAPLWVMAWLLRGLRSLSLAMAGGTLVFVGLILLMRLIDGPPNLMEWVAFFNCRFEAAGITESQLRQFLPEGSSFEEAVNAVMIGWPLSISLLQLGLLFLARWLQARCYYPGGFQRDFHSLRQPKLLAYVCGAMLFVVVIASPSWVTLLHVGILALVLMGITGLGFVHGYLAMKKRSAWWLVLVYGLMIFNTWAALMLFAILALLDSGFHLRERVR